MIKSNYRPILERVQGKVWRIGGWEVPVIVKVSQTLVFPPHPLQFLIQWKAAVQELGEGVLSSSS